MEQGTFARVKAAVSAPQVWQRYGGEEMRGGYVRCAFHDDHNPSMRLYEGDRGYYCFACGAGGDAVTLAGKLLGLAPYAAVQRVAADFHVAVPEGKIDRDAIRRVDRRLQRERAFAAWQRNAERTLADYHCLLRQAKMERAPKAREDGIDPAFAEACRHLEYAEYALEWLGEDPMGFYKANRDYVERAVKRIEQLHG